MLKYFLIICYDMEWVKIGDMFVIDDVVDILFVLLIGVVLESKDVLKVFNVGFLIMLVDEILLVVKVYMEVFWCLFGENILVIIFEEKKSLFGKIFKGRVV